MQGRSCRTPPSRSGSATFSSAVELRHQLTELEYEAESFTPQSTALASRIVSIR